MEQEQDDPTVGNLYRKRGLMDEWNYFSGRHFSVFAADNFAYYEAVGWAALISFRSEERRVGKECRIGCRSRWSPYH